MKKFKTYEEQLHILKSRGLIIKNPKFVIKKLREDGYYNIINGYKNLFLNPTIKEDEYHYKSSFEEIYALYEFDKEIRSILFQYILKVESMVKSLISYTFSKFHGVDNYLKINNFDLLDKQFVGIKKAEERVLHIQKLISTIHNETTIALNDKPYINYYMIEYGYIPFWVLVNILSLGTLSRFYGLMKQNERVEIAKNWNISEKELKQYLAILAFFRNLCAHNERLYCSHNKTSIVDNEYHKITEIDKINLRYRQGKNDIFSLVIVLKILLSPTDFNDFINKFEGKMKKMKKKIKSIDANRILDIMGFPEKWKKIKSPKTTRET